MLSMKTLRVAIVTMGSALLLGPGMAAAVEIILDSRHATDKVPVVYAVETLAGDATTVSKVDYYPLATPDELPAANGGDPTGMGLFLTVQPNRLIEGDEDVFVRIELSEGMIFSSAPALVTSPSDDITGPANDQITSGGVEESFVVFRVTGSTDLTTDVMHRNADAPGGITVDVSGDLAAALRPGVYTATMTAYGNADDATEGVGARGTLFSGSSVAVQVIEGLDTKVLRGTAGVAEVTAGFLWF